MEVWAVLVMQLLKAHIFLECEKHPLTICNCCLSYSIAMCHNSGFLHMVFGRLEKFATVLSRRNVGYEKRLERIGSVIPLHLCHVLSSDEMKMGNILNKSLFLYKEICLCLMFMFR